MIYEEAKELEQAGFPQPLFCEAYGGVWVREQDVWIRAPKDRRGYVYVPTLEELIAACGDRFSYLHQDSTRTWAANSHAKGDMEVYGRARGVGKTPREAVVNLWLSLHTKP